LNPIQSQRIGTAVETDNKFAMQSSTLLDELNKLNQSKLDKTLKKAKKKKKKNLAKFLVSFFIDA
jgi:response regulator of citrate/malate metabolism